MEEVWKDIPGYDRDYQISSYGRIRYHLFFKTKPTLEKITYGTKRTRGYMFFNLRRNGKNSLVSIHRLVAISFIPNPDNLPVVNHKDENTSNNHVDNLEWCTQKHNANWGRCSEKRSKSHSRPVVCYSPQGDVIGEYPSIKEASKTLGIRECRIQSCCLMQSLSCNGKIWGYKDRPDLLNHQIKAFWNSKQPHLTQRGIIRKKH